MKSSLRPSAVRDGPTPMHQQIRTLLTDEIISGRAGPGVRLPSESQLSEMHDVSRITVRRALQDLMRDGLIERVVGKGTFVKATKAERTATLTGFGENMRAIGKRPAYRTLAVSKLPSPPEVSRRLAIAADEEVVFIRRLLLADNALIALAESWIRLGADGAVLEHLTIDGLNARSLYSILEHEGGLRLGSATEEIEPTLADSTLAERLEIPEGSPVLKVTRLLRDREMRPFEDATIHYVPTRYRFRIELRRSGAMV